MKRKKKKASSQMYPSCRQIARRTLTCRREAFTFILPRKGQHRDNYFETKQEKIYIRNLGKNKFFSTMLSVCKRIKDSSTKKACGRKIIGFLSNF